jgi:hypothetical protein
MNKWGVRLIAVFLFIWAISDLHNLITGNELTPVFIGFDLMLNRDGIPIHVMAWVEALVLVYAGVQLLRFNPCGRYGALTMLLINTIRAGGYLIWMIVIMVVGLYHSGSDFWWQFSLVDGVSYFSFLFAMVIFFVYYFIPTYYLMRRDVKQLFQKAITTAENNSNLEAPLP